MLRRSSRARQIVRTLIVASICLTAVQATAAGSSSASQSGRAAENAQVRAAESAASALGLGSVKWDRKAFYTRDAMEKWLRSRGLKYRSWAKAHTAAAARLMKNSVVANKRPPAPAPKPPAPAPTPPPPARPRRRLRPLRLLPGTRANAACSDPARSGSDPSAGTCTCTCTCTTTPPAASTGGAKGSIGVAAGGSIVWYDDAKLAKELDGYAAVGAKWIRFDLAWSAVERQQGVYDWAVYDRFVAKARERGLNMIAMVGYTPTWARVAGGTDDKFPPKNVADYGSFAQKAVERYAPKGLKVYELWNEPNLGCCFWKPKADAARYTELVKAAYGRMKSVDPSITVLTGGTSPADTHLDVDLPAAVPPGDVRERRQGPLRRRRAPPVLRPAPDQLVQALVVMVADDVRHRPRQEPPEPDGRERRRGQEDLGQRGKHARRSRSASTGTARPSSVRPR